MVDQKPFVLALAGPPGAGKSTLASLLQQRHPAARAISFDQYQPLTGLSQTQISKWFAEGADLGEVDHVAIVAELKRRTENRPGLAPLVLFETPFGRIHRETGAFIDALVWVDTPLDLALSRAVLAFTRNAQRDMAPPDFMAWQIRYMTFYPVVRAMYLAQRERVAPGADLIIDGSRPPEASVESIERLLALRGVAL